jgi:predicted enzyme related to lactoylglutathione lyase
MDKPPMRVLQMRLVVEAVDYDEAVRFYRDVLGLPEELAVAGPDGAHVTILAAGRATLEIANPAQKDFIDRVETGRAGVAPKVRVAFEVADAAEATEMLVAGGATLIAAPVETPWSSLNARLTAPAGLQLTLFQELEPADPGQ